jgi:hypothetical protein
MTNCAITHTAYDILAASSSSEFRFTDSPTMNDNLIFPDKVSIPFVKARFYELALEVSILRSRLMNERGFMPTEHQPSHTQRERNARSCFPSPHELMLP